MFSVAGKLLKAVLVRFFSLIGMPKETIDDAAGNLRWLGHFLKADKARLIFLLFLTPINAWITFEIPKIIEQIVDDMETSISSGVMPETSS